MHIGRVVRILIWPAIAVCAVASFVFWMTDPYYLMAPPDQKLIVLFHEQRPAFEELRQMSTEDSPREGYFSRFYLDEQLTQPRKQKYRKLLSEIHRGLTVNAGQGEVSYNFAWGGLLAIGPEWTKGIVYLPEGDKTESVIVQNLDKPSKFPPGLYLRQIEPHWFIFYDDNPG